MVDYKEFQDVEHAIIKTARLLESEWNGGFPCIRLDDIEKIIGHKNKDCSVVEHGADEGPLTGAILDEYLKNHPYAIVRKYYHPLYEPEKVVNHTFLIAKIVKEDGEEKKIYDSWYFTNNKSKSKSESDSEYFSKCFDEDVEKEYNFSKTGFQQDKNQGVCAIFALATYFAIKTQKFKKLEEILKRINEEIRVHKITGSLRGEGERY